MFHITDSRSRLSFCECSYLLYFSFNVLLQWTKEIEMHRLSTL